jgi:hypothetical protein
MSTHTHSGHRRRNDGLSRVAFWQLMVFTMLLLVIWVNEIVDLSALWFGTPPRPADVFRGCVLSVATILAAIVGVGLTYEQQKRIISGLLTVCAQCRKIRIEQQAWEHLDDYVAAHSLVVFTHGLCPECFERAEQEILDLGRTPKTP